MSENVLNLDTLEIFTEESEAENSNEATPEEKTEGKEENKEKNDKPIEINSNKLFEESEGVDGKEGKEKGGDATKKEEDGQKSSPKQNFYSTIATSFKEDGIFSTLSDEDIAEVKDAESFAELVKKQINTQLDDTQKRIKEALENGIEVGEIQQYEKTLAYLDSLTEEAVINEEEQGISLRKQLIFQDYINRGFTSEKAKKEMEKSFSVGTDIEDAKEALQSNKEYFSGSYKNIIDQAKEEKNQEITSTKKQAGELEKKILDTEKPFESLTISEKTRKQVLDTITKPTYKDESGAQYNAIQKYAKENPIDFQYYLSLFFTLTDGFKDLTGLAKGEIQKQTRKSIKELEHTLNNTRTNQDGSFKYVGAEEDEDSYEGLRLDVE